MADKIVEQEDEGRYGYGTTPAIETMFKRISSYRLETTGLVAINIDTLVRNTCSSDLKVADVVSKVCGYMANIAQDFCAIVQNWKTVKHYIVFYHADAERPVAPLFRRVHGGASGLLAKEATAAVIERVKNSKVQSRDNVTSMICLANEMKQPTYKGLVEVFNRLTDKSVTVHMLSHCPIDWHIERLGRLGVLYRSYTGVAVEMTATKLGEVVFDEKGIPFYPITHVLLGDKTMIKGLLTKKDRDQFREMAIRDRFIYRSESYIAGNAKINKSLIPYRLD